MASNKVINTILNLKDNMSKGLLSVSKNTKEMSKELKQASRQASLMASQFGKSVESMTTKAVKLSASVAGIAGAFALKTGISEGLDLEGYRVQLDTAVKDTQKATELMQNAVAFANKTPFETGSVVEATAKMEMYGLSSTRWLSDIADMAGATNKSIDQATEAMADVAVGEFERLKEFGIKKDMIVAEAKKAYGDGVVFDNKGSVKDQEKLLDTVQKMMKDKYEGGAEKLSKTVKGMWSTVTGVTKNALAQIMGIGSDGIIKAGTLLDTIRTKMKVVADALVNMQENGTLASIAEKATIVFNAIIDGISNLISFIMQHKDLFGALGAMALGFTATMKAIKLLMPVIKAFQLVWALFNGTLMLTPIGWVIVGITALCGALYLAWNKSETFRNSVMELGNKFLELIQKIQPLLDVVGGIFVSVFSGAFTLVSGLCQTFAQFLADKMNLVLTVFGGVIDFITGVFTGNWTQAWEGVKSIFVGVWEGIKNTCKAVCNSIIDIVNGVIGGINKFTSIEIGGKSIGFTVPSIPKFSTGTGYFSGGIAEINEHGGELVNLPNGSKVIPADKTDRILNNAGSSPQVNITIQGNVIGNHQFINEMGSMITKQLKLALAN